MRAKEYLYQNESRLTYAKEIKLLLEKLSQLRLDKEGTEKFFNCVLLSDTHKKSYNFQLRMHGSKNAMQQDSPVFENYDNEVAIESSSAVRNELFEVIRGDASYGYLFYLLGTERNATLQGLPIDCIPDFQRIKNAVSDNRDWYPRVTLDAYLEDDFNYAQYDEMLSKFELTESQLLQIFNKAYNIYDEVRCVKVKISSVQKHLDGFEFSDDSEKYIVFSVVQNMIKQFGSQDVSLLRCNREIERRLLPLHNELAPDTNNVEAQKAGSKVFLNSQKGKKLDLIRIINVMYELDFFKNESQNKITKKEVFETLGNFLNIDLSRFQNDLSRSLTDSTALEKHLKVFEDMQDKMEQIFNSK